MSPEDQLVQPTPNPHKPRVSERALQQRRVMDARHWAQDATLGNPRYRYRIKSGLQDGTLSPVIEKTVLEIAYGRPAEIDKRLLDAVATAGAGLITFFLRRPLTEDPLAEAKPVDGKVIEREPARPALTAGQLESIIPPARPAKKPKGSGPPLGPGEEVLQ